MSIHSCPITRRIFLPALLGLLAAPALAGVQHYQARLHEARWETRLEQMVCILSHEIPHYGRVEFRRRGRDELVFTVHAERGPLLQTEAQLSSDPTDWKHQVASRELDPLAAVLGRQPFQIEGARARRLFTELEQGMAPTLQYRDWSDGLDQVTVRISPVFFRTAQREFMDCVGDPSHFGMAEGGPTRVYFAFDSAALTPLGREVLEQTVRHLGQQRRGLVLVEGHASSEGGAGYNLSLSRQRAITVRNFLMQRGIPRERFEVRFLGASRPIADNDTEAGRIRNRRVELRATAG
jgi:outer membrane protein OmpA-like peptidoglycan-associated protein